MAASVCRVVRPYSKPRLDAPQPFSLLCSPLGATCEPFESSCYRSIEALLLLNSKIEAMERVPCLHDVKIMYLHYHSQGIISQCGTKRDLFCDGLPGIVLQQRPCKLGNRVDHQMLAIRAGGHVHKSDFAFVPYNNDKASALRLSTNRLLQAL